MTRTVAREIAVLIGYSIGTKNLSPEEALDTFFDNEYFSSLKEENILFSEYPSRKQREYISSVVTGVYEHMDEFDERIKKYAKGWKLSRISRIAQTVLRTAMFEVLYMDEVPNSVAINEAVELSKGYEEQETVAFINGILGSFMREELGLQPGSSPEEKVDEGAEDQEAAEFETTKVPRDTEE